MNRVLSLQAHKSAGSAQGRICRSFTQEDSSNLGCYHLLTGYLVLDISKALKCLHVYWHPLNAGTFNAFTHKFK